MAWTTASGSMNNVCPEEDISWMIPPKCERYSALTGITKRSLRIVTIASDSILVAFLPRVYPSSFSRTRPSCIRRLCLMERKVPDALSITNPLSSMEALISCSNPVSIGNPSFFAKKCGMSISSSASMASINWRRILLARIVLAISINSYALRTPPICARFACGRISLIPPIGTLPRTRNIDSPSSVSSSNRTTSL